MRETRASGASIAGRTGDADTLFLKKQRVALGWTKLGDALAGEFVAAPLSQDETVVEDTQENTRDYVLKRLAQEAKGHPFADLVAHLLNTMGYRTRVSPEGPDGGVDILAHKDELGFEPPIVKVQVKSRRAALPDPSFREQIVQSFQEVAVAVESELMDPTERRARTLEVPRACRFQELTQIGPILGTIAVVAGEDLQRDQVRDGGHGNDEAGEDLHRIRSGRQIRLDAGRSKHEVDHHSAEARLAGR